MQIKRYSADDQVLYCADQGDPVFSPDRKEIWAFFAESIESTNPKIKFLTMDAVLGKDLYSDSADVVPRTPDVTLVGRTWVAGGETTQEDFAGSSMFHFYPKQGPYAALLGIEALLSHKYWSSIFHAKVSYTGAEIEHLLRYIAKHIKQRETARMKRRSNF